MAARRPPPARAAVLALPWLLLTGCASFVTLPSVEIVGVDLVSLGLQGGTVEVTLAVANEGTKEMNLQRFLYNLQVQDSGEEGEWILLAEGSHDQAISLAAQTIQEVAIPVSFEYRNLGSAVRSLFSRGEIPYRVSGEVWVGGSSLALKVPFRDEGVVRP